MAYQQLWGSNHPGHLVFLLDFSGSMEENSKIDHLLNAVEECCKELVSKCEDGVLIKNRFTLTIIGYNSDVFTLWKGNVEELDEYINDRSGSSSFFDDENATPQWQTYTAKAFRMVASDINEWINKQPDKRLAPAPLVIHVTDGFPYEEERSEDMARTDALRAAQEIMNLDIPDGHPLLFNIHIGKETDNELLFPSHQPALDGQDFLYDASSIMPDSFIKSGQDAGYSTIVNGSRFMVSNLRNPADIARLISWGSSVVLDNKEEPKPRL